MATTNIRPTSSKAFVHDVGIVERLVKEIDFALAANQLALQNDILQVFDIPADVEIKANIKVLTVQAGATIDIGLDAAGGTDDTLGSGLSVATLGYLTQGKVLNGDAKVLTITNKTAGALDEAKIRLTVLMVPLYIAPVE